MPTIDINEEEILTAFDKGQRKSVATKSELAKFKSMSLNKSELNTFVVVFLIKREFKKG